jgi:hypothetical protein
MEGRSHPHYLRVVQALAFVTTVGPIAIVIGPALPGCGGYSPPTGFIGAPEVDSGALSGDAGADVSVVPVGILIPPSDSGTDAPVPIGGPLSPPELPA